MTWWHDDMMTWWHDDMMKWWGDPWSLIMIKCLLSNVYRLKCSNPKLFPLTHSLTRVSLEMLAHLKIYTIKNRFLFYLLFYLSNQWASVVDVNSQKRKTWYGAVMSDFEVKTSFLSLGKASILQINRIVNPCAHSLFNWVISSNEHFVFLCFSFCTQIPDNLLYFLVIFIKILQWSLESTISTSLKEGPVLN